MSLYFALAALVASLLLAVVTYAVARSYLLDQRDEVALSQAFNNAQSVRSSLRADREPPGDLIRSVRTEGEGYALLHLTDDDQFFPQDLRFTQDGLPSDLEVEVLGGTTGLQLGTVDGEPYVVVGVDIAELGAHYFEAFPLRNVERTLRIIGTALVAGVIASVVVSAVAGWWMSRRLLRPLSRVADAAGEIASGSLDARLEPENDPDLDRLASSFNEMADAVQTRIEREARFASDVSHELRTPITSLSAAVEVLDGRRDELPERSQQALDVVVSQVRRFDQMVLDLLELSRLDAGTSELHRDPVSLPSVVAQIAQHNGYGAIPIAAGPGADRPIDVDKRRLERIVVNLLDNARDYAGGATGITIDSNGDGLVLLGVEDAGPGVSAGERRRIFERFSRGTAARHRVGGTGLGLALVAEHAMAHGGDAWVEDRPEGGARFVVSFPVARP